MVASIPSSLLRTWKLKSWTRYIVKGKQTYGFRHLLNVNVKGKGNPTGKQDCRGTGSLPSNAMLVDMCPVESQIGS